MSRLLCLGCLCLLLAPLDAAAEWHVTPMVGLTFAGNTSLADPDLATDNVHANLGGAFTVLGSGIVGAEGVVIFTPKFFQAAREDQLVETIASSRSLVMMGKVMVTVPRRWTEYFLRPFVSAGVGLLHASFSEKVDVFGPISENVLGFNVGGGAIGFLSANTGLRFDLRYFGNLGRLGRQNPTRPDDRVHLRYMTASIGLVFRR